jgi:hypothetical protein
VKLRKELKKMGLIAGKKKSEQMFKVGIVMWALFVLIILYSVIGG